MTEFRRILLDGYPLQVERVGEELVAPDGRKIAIKDAVHLAPSEPTKIVAVHLNYDSAELSQRGCGSPGGLQVAQLRG